MVAFLGSHHYSPMRLRNILSLILFPSWRVPNRNLRALI
jgi:hypothetical protein